MEQLEKRNTHNKQMRITSTQIRQMQKEKLKELNEHKHNSCMNLRVKIALQSELKLHLQHLEEESTVLRIMERQHHESRDHVLYEQLKTQHKKRKSRVLALQKRMSSKQTKISQTKHGSQSTVDRDRMKEEKAKEIMITLMENID